MKTVLLLALSLTVALGVPVLPPDVVQHPEDQSPLLGDQLPVQGHVVVENPAPQISPSSDKKPQTPEELKLKEKQEAKAEPEVEEELQAEPDFKVESEVKVEPNVQTEEEPEELREAHLAMMRNDAETEGRHELMMESESLNDDDDDDDDDDNLVKEVKNQEELPHGEIFRREDDVDKPLPEEEEDEFLRKKNVLDEQPVMVVEPGMMEEAEPNYVEDEEPLMEQLSRSYLPDEEAQMKMFVREEPEEDEDFATGGRSCPGMLLDGKCYLFFKAPKNYADAELFCQEQFSGGHLASITSPSSHREVMNLILMQNGAYTRTWVGGRRLDDHRFVWLDGSRWTYDDWLSGEPNNTAGVEDCVEVLAYGKGKFNDFTCWEPQSFICSYSYQ